MSEQNRFSSRGRFPRSRGRGPFRTNRSKSSGRSNIPHERNFSSADDRAYSPMNGRPSSSMSDTNFTLANHMVMRNIIDGTYSPANERPSSSLSERNYDVRNTRWKSPGPSRHHSGNFSPAKERTATPTRWKSPGRNRQFEKESDPSSNNPPRPKPGKKSEPCSSPVKKPPQPIVTSTPYSCAELLEALKSIQAVVQCVSCHKTLLSVRTCISGHGVCLTCKNRCSSVCPLCNTLIAENKPIMLNSMIKLLPRKCNFNDKGCECLVLASDMNHETFCRFRTVTCRIPSCETTCLAKDLLRHLEDCHGQEMIRSGAHSQILMNFDAKIERDGLRVIVAYNNIIWQHTRVGNNTLLQFYQYVPMEKPRAKFWVVVNFYTPENSYTKKTPIHTDIFNPTELFKDNETFCLPHKIATAFSRFYGGVNNEFKIIKEDL